MERQTRILKAQATNRGWSHGPVTNPEKFLWYQWKDLGMRHSISFLMHFIVLYQ